MASDATRAHIIDTIKESGPAGWEALWQAKTTPWDAGQCNPAFAELISSGQLPEGRALVPGCGSGYDVFALASPTRLAVGLDISETAVAKARELQRQMGVPEDRASFANKDFFQLPEDEKYNVVYDYTFFCAIPLSLRPAWAKKMGGIVAPGGELVTLMFPVDNYEGGPPFAVQPELFKSLLEPEGFKAISLEPVKNSFPARQGREYIGRWRKQ